MATFKKIWNIASTTLVILVVVCALLLMGSRLLGYQVFTVISGSMEPTYSVGDLLYVQKVNPTTIKVDDPITFLINEGSAVATHRVTRVEEREGDLYFYTKGDANKDEDQQPVHEKNVLGVPRFAIPKLGYVSDYVQNPPGMYVAIGVGALLVLMVFLPDLFTGKGKKEEDAETTAIQEEVSTAAAENERLKAEVEKLRAEMAAELTEAAEQQAEPAEEQAEAVEEQETAAPTEE